VTVGRYLIMYKTHSAQQNAKQHMIRFRTITAYSISKVFTLYAIHLVLLNRVVSTLISVATNSTLIT